MVIFLALFCFVVTSQLSDCQIYVDDSYPYGPGPYDVNVAYFSVLDPDVEGLPYHSTTFYPITEDVTNFGVYYFITGFFGTSASFIYDDFFPRIAAHGYVVFVTWVANEGADYEEHLVQMDWLRNNVPGQLGGAIPSFDHLTISCHSAGCAPQIKLMVNHTELFKAAVNFDPSSFSIQRFDLDVGIPVLNLGAEYGTNNPNATCVFPTLDFVAWHKRSTCPRIMMEAEDVGHCAIIDEEYWYDCVVTCGGPPSYDRLDEFKNVLKGNAVSFTGAYVQGNMDQLQYVANETLIPWTMLDFDADIDC